MTTTDYAALVPLVLAACAGQAGGVKDLAEATGMRRQQMSAHKNGRTVPGADTFLRAIDAAGGRIEITFPDGPALVLFGREHDGE